MTGALPRNRFLLINHAQLCYIFCMNNIIKLSCFVLAIAFGAFFVVYGEYDDSPGGQLIGVLAVIIGIVGGIRTIRSMKKTSDPDV